jgi:uncharacterized protein YbbC (DUF1343 family)
MKKLFLALITFNFSLFTSPVEAQVRVGAERMETYLPLLTGKRVGVVTNHTGLVEGTHLVDTLLGRGVDVELVFAPEHGFRGTAAAGEHVNSSRDAATGLDIVSLYGSNRKPTTAQIKRCDIVLFDIQDVGCRFYTYLSTMHLVMESCAESGIPLVVLDRPNPNGMLVDGPVLDTTRHRSFVGMHPIPVLHGMTLGELALMIDGEGWLANGVHCDLRVVECTGWTRQSRYRLPVAPSPALPNMRAVYLYPSLCYFEATTVGVGRGGKSPFQILTLPGGTTVDLRTGAAGAPTNDQLIANGIDLGWLIDAYRADAAARASKASGTSAAGRTAAGGKKFLSPFFEKLMGVDWVRQMIESGRGADEIRARWAGDVAQFRQLRQKYLMYN